MVISEVTIPQSPAVIIPTVDEIVHDQAFYIGVHKRIHSLHTIGRGRKTWSKLATCSLRPRRICRRDEKEVPHSIADRVKIYCAAHAILACTAFVDMTRHTPAARLEILEKSNFKCHENLPPPTTQTPHLNPLMRSTANPRKRLLTTEDYTLFAANPTTLIDKQFLLEEEGDPESFRVYGPGYAQAPLVKHI